MTSKSILDERRQSLENSFFHQRDQQLLTRLKEEAIAQDQQQALTDATGITDLNVLSHFQSLGLHLETWSALTLAPLVQVAWADGHVHDNERDAILKSAAEVGIQDGTAASNLLHNWLGSQPSPELAAAWQAYVKELVSKLSEPQRKELEGLVLGARRVAEAAGGFLGLAKKVSAAEERTLTELASAFKQ